MSTHIYETEILGVHLCYMDVSGLDVFAEYPKLSQYRYEKLSKLKKESDKKLSLGAELLLMHILEKYFPEVSAPPEIKTKQRGKPYIEGVNFSLAHAGNIAVCAVSDTELGVDIERTDRKNQGVAEKYFTNEEKKHDFSYIWTRKEAAVKADGGGIAIGLDTFDVTADTLELCNRKYRLITVDTDLTGYCISLCVQSDVV